MPGTSVVLAAGGRNRGPPRGSELKVAFPMTSLLWDRVSGVRGEEMIVQVAMNQRSFTMLALDLLGWVKSVSPRALG